VLIEYQISLTTDSASGSATAYILSLHDGGPWNWIADTELGPFDTASDFARWMTKKLVEAKAFHLR
jgi:hypothetical protein